MNRNGTAILATAILFSMPTTAGARPAPSPASGTTAPSQRPAASSTNPANTDDDLGIRLTADSKQKGNYA